MVDLNLEADTQLVTVTDPDPTVSVLWDKAVQQAVIDTSPGPTVASRTYSPIALRYLMPGQLTTQLRSPIYNSSISMVFLSGSRMGLVSA